LQGQACPDAGFGKMDGRVFVRLRAEGAGKAVERAKKSLYELV
jgi:hypothetical protein